MIIGKLFIVFCPEKLLPSQSVGLESRIEGSLTFPPPTMVRIAKFCQEIIKPLLPPENTSNNIKMRVIFMLQIRKIKVCKTFETNFMDLIGKMAEYFLDKM